jgi:hypothetical protein
MACHAFEAFRVAPHRLDPRQNFLGDLSNLRVACASAVTNLTGGEVRPYVWQLVNRLVERVPAGVGERDS